MDWTSAQIDYLRQLWGEGHSTAAIGRAMGISKNAVIGKAHRLELPARPSPINLDPNKPREPKPPKPAAALPSNVVELRPMPTLQGGAGVLPTAAVEVVQARARSEAELKAHRAPPPPPPAPYVPPKPATRPGQCQWIEGTERGAPKCGDPLSAATRLPYCDHHHKMAVAPPKERRTA